MTNIIMKIKNPNNIENIASREERQYKREIEQIVDILKKQKPNQPQITKEQIMHVLGIDSTAFDIAYNIAITKNPELKFPFSQEVLTPVILPKSQIVSNDEKIADALSLSAIIKNAATTAANHGNLNQHDKINETPTKNRVKKSEPKVVEEEENRFSRRYPY